MLPKVTAMARQARQGEYHSQEQGGQPQEQRTASRQRAVAGRATVLTKPFLPVGRLFCYVPIRNPPCRFAARRISYRPACSARVSRRHFRAFLSRVHEAALFLALRFALPGESVVNRQGRSVVSAEKNREVCRRAEIGSESGFGCGTEIGGSPETKKGARTRKIFPFFT